MPLLALKRTPRLELLGALGTLGGSIPHERLGDRIEETRGHPLPAELRVDPNLVDDRGLDRETERDQRVSERDRIGVLPMDGVAVSRPCLERDPLVRLPVAVAIERLEEFAPLRRANEKPLKGPTYILLIGVICTLLHRAYICTLRHRGRNLEWLCHCFGWF